MRARDEDSEYVGSGEAGRLLGVSARTVDRWADAGLIGYTLTLGRHRRFRRIDIERVADQMQVPSTSPVAEG